MRNDLLEALLEEESLRDEIWMEGLVRIISGESVPVITKTEYDRRYNIIRGKFSDSELDKIFTGPVMKALQEKLSIEGRTVYFFERILNAIIDERTSAGLNITLNSLDPSKNDLKKQDRDLLVSRKAIESLTAEVTDNNGMPPIKVTDDDFHGNISEFDEAGFDEADEENVKDFFDSRYGLKTEMNLQNPLNAIFRTNQFIRNYDKYIVDIIVCLTVCSQVTVDDIDGKIKIEYLHPYDVSILQPNEGNHKKESQGFLLKRNSNFRGILRKFSKSFSLEKNWPYLLNMINVRRVGMDALTGLSENGRIVLGTGPIETCMGMKDFLDTSVTYGYTEVRVVNNNTVLKGKTAHGNPVSIPYLERTEQHDGWEIETTSKEDTYRAFFIDNGATPRLLKWGKLYMQPIEGAYDEYTGFSIMVNSRDGVPISKVLEPFYNIMQKAFAFVEVMINDVKPDGDVYVYDSIIKILEEMQNAKDTPTDIANAMTDFIIQQQNSPSRITTTPTDEEGNNIGGDAFGGVKKNPNGLNGATEGLMKVMDWVELKATAYMGTQGIEVADPNDGFKLSLENRKRSRASTQFIDFILLNHIEDIGIILLSYVQDICKYPDIPAYKYLLSLVGEQITKFIGKMKKSPHRYSTFIDTFNNDIQLAEIVELARIDLNNGRITLEQYAFIRKFDNLSQTIFYLAQERKKADKQKQKEQLTILQQQDANAQAEHLRKLELEDRKGMWLEKRSQAEALGFSNAAQLNAQARIEAEHIKNDGQSRRQSAQAIDDINQIAEKATKEAQKPVS